jgi:AAA+ ATPase superfamily predicted ATPase
MDLKTATQIAKQYLRDDSESKSLGKNLSEIIQLYVRNIVAYVVKQEDAKVQRLYSKIADLEQQLDLEQSKVKDIQKVHSNFKDNITNTNNIKYVQAAMNNLVDLNNTIEGLMAGEECYPNTLYNYCQEAIENLNKITG